MEKQLNGKKVLVLVANGVDEAVMSSVQRDLLKSGATVKTSGMESGLVNSWNNNTWGLYFPVDLPIGQTLGSDFDCLVVPSGARSVQKLATSAHCERILASFLTARKQVVLVGDAVTLLEKTGLGAAAANAPNVMTGDFTDAAAFIESMMAHLDVREDVKVAA
jgi:protease I